MMAGAQALAFFMNLHLKPILFSISWALFIALLCGLPGKDLPSVSWLELISFDKFVHATLFFVQFNFTSKALCYQPYSRSLRHFHHKISLLFCTLYGGVLELLQGAIFLDRSADVYDFIANTAGVFISYVVFRNKITNDFYS